ncbi:L-rhamnose mutarotase [Caulobacter sp.]|uniref:L-rhamnose mutarotase n=1 Tax=Caulobacter sp. TaxID=78 RepID=UPI0031E2A4D8
MRHCFALDLQDDADAIARYEAWHRPGAPPETVTRSIRNADIRELEIWRVHDRMFMIMEVGPAFSPQAKAAADMASEDVQAWETLMWSFQKPLPQAAPGEKWLAMEKIYALSEQP